MNDFFSNIISRMHSTLQLILDFRAKALSMWENAKAFVMREYSRLKKSGIVPRAEEIFMRVSLKDQILLIKQLSILIRAGVPMLASLRMMKEQGKSKTMVKILDSVIHDVENGQYLSTALGKFKHIFGELTINIIAIGEISGTLSDNLDHLALALKKRQILRQKVISASVYPIFIIIATILITVMLVVFVFPKIIPIFKSIHYDLPWTTKLLISTSNLMQYHGLLVAGIVAAVIIAVFFLLRIKRVHTWYYGILLSIPFVQRLIQTYNMANTCRTVGLLLTSGTSVVRVFQITSHATTNLLYSRELNAIADQIVTGERISTHLANHPKLFPTMASQMVSVGETTGKLSETFLYLADIYEDEMDELAKNLSTTIEPLLLLFMGILVGFVAISIITPIYGITQHLTPK